MNVQLSKKSIIRKKKIVVNNIVEKIILTALRLIIKNTYINYFVNNQTICIKQDVNRKYIKILNKLKNFK